MERWLPTRLRPARLETVEAAIRRLQAEYGGTHVRMDPAKGEMQSQRLREDGLPVEEYTFSEGSIDRLASTLARLFAERRIAVPDVEDLLDELRTVILPPRATGRRNQGDPRDSQHDRASDRSVKPQERCQDEDRGDRPQRSSDQMGDGARARCG